RCAAPVTDVRLIPDLPVPGLKLGPAIFFQTMFRPLENELRPFLIVLWRIGPSSIDVFVTRARCPLMLIRLRLDGEVLWHEADLHVWSYAAVEVGVENAIENGPVVNRLPLTVLAVSAG